MPTKQLIPLAKGLRKNATDAERLLWSRLRASQLGGCKFRRQQPLGSYIVDFVSFDKKIVVELDGGQHVESEAYDQSRMQRLASQGFKVMRFWNNDVLSNTEGVLHTIMTEIGNPLP